MPPPAPLKSGPRALFVVGRSAWAPRSVQAGAGIRPVGRRPKNSDMIAPEDSHSSGYTPGQPPGLSSEQAHQDAWTDLFLLDGELVKSRVRRCLGSHRRGHFELESLCHEVWMKAMKRYPDLPGRTQVEAHRLLSTIARNTVLDYRRRERFLEEPTGGSEDGSVLDWIADEDELPFRAVSGEEQIFILRECLLMLNPADRDLIHQRYLAQRTFEELGSGLSIDESTARKRCLKAKQRLKELLMAKGLTLSQLSRSRST
jgi:RNA polymerase sigma factor (sigma-70 family)